MENENLTSSITPFQTIYDRFLGMITDDMYVEWSYEQTVADLQNILLNAIPRFEYPRFKIFDYVITEETAKVVFEIIDETGEPTGETEEVDTVGYFNSILSKEEIAILSRLMLIEWVGRQINDINVTRMKYGSADFKLTSQANHLDKLLKLRVAYLSEMKSMQRLYRRREINSEGYVRPNFSGLGGSVYEN